MICGGLKVCVGGGGEVGSDVFVDGGSVAVAGVQPLRRNIKIIENAGNFEDIYFYKKQSCHCESTRINLRDYGGDCFVGYRLLAMTDQLFSNSFFTRSYVDSSSSGNTRVSPTVEMKFVSPFQRGTMWMWTCSFTPAPAASPMFTPTLNPCG